MGNEGISERFVGRTHALQNRDNRQLWFKIKDISAFWRPELGGNADSEVQGNLGNAPDTAWCISSHLIVHWCQLWNHIKGWKS